MFSVRARAPRAGLPRPFFVREERDSPSDRRPGIPRSCFTLQGHCPSCPLGRDRGLLKKCLENQETYHRSCAEFIWIQLFFSCPFSLLERAGHKDRSQDRGNRVEPKEKSESGTAKDDQLDQFPSPRYSSIFGAKIILF